MFAHLRRLPDDPILGLSAIYLADKNPHKVDLSVGVYKDTNGSAPIMHAVRKAEKRYVQEQTTKSYIGIAGDRGFVQEMEKLVHGNAWLSANAARIRTVQTPGGCAAIYAAAVLVRHSNPSARVWVSEQTWSNHIPIFQAAGLEVVTYPYYDRREHAVLFDEMMATLEGARHGDVLLLHGCCHNPTGADLSSKQWKKIADFVCEHQLLPLVDLAYQGFGNGLEEDVSCLRTLVRQVPEALITLSCSKNFGLYRDRVGCLSLVAASDSQAEAACSHVLKIARTSYSMPPAHGAGIVQTILSDSDLTAEWTTELNAMRGRIATMRRRFAQTLSARLDHDFAYLETGQGMFSFINLGADQIGQLKNAFGVYIVDSGRINICGLTETNVDYMVDAIKAVWYGGSS